MKNLNSEEYHQMIKSDNLSVIKMGAIWCGPCRVLAPILQSVSEKFEDVNFGEIDVDNQPEIAREQSVRSVPTILFFKNGEIVDKMVGLQQAEVYESKINSLK
jgi:thioredoxin 1